MAPKKDISGMQISFRHAAEERNHIMKFKYNPKERLKVKMTAILLPLLTLKRKQLFEKCDISK